tara:strand:- start:98 stop:328 length:231 start_codon:yes stop_codon:yes gene_type:complete
MSDKKWYDFYEIGKNGSPLYEVPIESIESRGYKKAVKSFQNKYPKLKKVDVFWFKDGIENCKEQKLPMGRKKKLEG